MALAEEWYITTFHTFPHLRKTHRTGTLLGSKQIIEKFFDENKSLHLPNGEILEITKGTIDRWIKVESSTKGVLSSPKDHYHRLNKKGKSHQ